MAGIYIHIPFCKQACSYCNFHFSTKLSNKQSTLNAIAKEMALRSDYITESGEPISFGGGTPSLLNQREIEVLLEQIHKNYQVSNDVEICLEANPDDLSKEKLIELAKTPVNRLSIGVQSFHDKDLQFFTRAHNSKEAKNSILHAKELGFKNISIDLIFGSPTTSDSAWEENLAIFQSLDVAHLSAYSLTLEEETKLFHGIHSGKIVPIDEDANYRQYQMLQQFISNSDFEQYELSNYCRDEKYSKHNSSYWLGKPYLGVGPSAHSFNGESRQWNASNNGLYNKAIASNNKFFEKEELSEIDRYHELLITALRTKWGIALNEIRTTFSEHIVAHFEKQTKKLDKSLINLTKDSLTIKPSFLFQSDQVIRELMVDFEA